MRQYLEGYFSVLTAKSHRVICIRLKGNAARTHTHIHYILYELEEPGYETTKHTVVAKHVKQIIHRTAYCHCLAASGGYAYNHPPLEDRSRVHHPSVRDQSHCVSNPSVAYEEFPSGKIPLTARIIPQF